MFNPKKSPYQGSTFVVLAMILPPILLTWMFYSLIMLWQARFGHELNWVSAKLFGCGIGIVFHMACLLMGAFAEPYQTVKDRVREFFSDLSVSVKLAFRWYFEDIKVNGIAFWIYFSVAVINIWVFVDALIDFIAIEGWKFLN